VVPAIIFSLLAPTPLIDAIHKAVFNIYFDASL
jgi:hypothetical protein